MGPPTKRRKVATTTVEEINFDPDARQEFLTGFHKRKLERAKNAQKTAEKKAREERNETRRKLREERKADIQRSLDANKAVMESMRDSSDGEAGGAGSEDDEDEEWEGFAEPPAVDYEAEYIDEDKYTTVTVEDLDPSKEEEDGVKPEGEEGEAGKNGGANGEGEKGQKKTPSIARKNARTKGKPDKPKGRKKKFRYESYAERKVTRLKDRAGNKAKAKARQEQ